MSLHKEPPVDGYCPYSVYIDGIHTCQLEGNECTSLSSNGIPSQYDCRKYTKNRNNNMYLCVGEHIKYPRH